MKTWFEKAETKGELPWKSRAGIELFEQELSRAKKGEGALVLIVCKGGEGCQNVQVREAVLGERGERVVLELDSEGENNPWENYFDLKKRVGRDLPISPSAGICSEHAKLIG